jgi:hypothetical protein
MLHQFLGFASHDRNCVPDVIYFGTDASAGYAAAEATGQKYVRLGRIGVTTVIPIALPESPEHKKLREEAEALARPAAPKVEADPETNLPPEGTITPVPETNLPPAATDAPVPATNKPSDETVSNAEEVTAAPAKKAKRAAPAKKAK